MSRVDVVIFGASGDLARRKILPSLGRMAAREGQNLRVIGAGRTRKTTEEFRDDLGKATQNGDIASTAEWVSLDYSDPASFRPFDVLLLMMARVAEETSRLNIAIGNDRLREIMTWFADEKTTSLSSTQTALRPEPSRS